MDSSDLLDFTTLVLKFFPGKKNHIGGFGATFGRQEATQGSKFADSPISKHLYIPDTSQFRQLRADFSRQQRRRQTLRETDEVEDQVECTVNVEPNHDDTNEAFLLE